MKYYTVVAQPYADRVKLVRWLRSQPEYVTKISSLPSAIKLADEMIAGKQLEYELFRPTDLISDVDVVTVEVENSGEKWARECQEHEAIFNKAVAGDGEAAILYCQMVKRGEISMGAFAG
jgi:hypothetical protein